MIDSMAELDSWERQARESARHHGYFRRFLELGRTRTLTRLHKNLTNDGEKISYGQVRNIAAQWVWTARAGEYDRHEDAILLAEVREQRAKLCRTQLAVAAGMLHWTAVHLGAMNKDKALALSPTEVARWTKEGTAVARAALGLPDATVALTGADGPSFAPIAAMTDQTRQVELGECLAELGRRIAAGEDLADEDTLLAFLTGGP